MQLQLKFEFESSSNPVRSLIFLPFFVNNLILNKVESMRKKKLESCRPRNEGTHESTFF